MLDTHQIEQPVRDQLAYHECGVISRIYGEIAKEWDALSDCTILEKARMKEYLSCFVSRSEYFPTIFSRATSNIQARNLAYREFYGPLFSLITWYEYGGDQINSVDVAPEGILKKKYSHSSILIEDIHNLIGEKLDLNKCDRIEKEFSERMSEMLSQESEFSTLGSLIGLYIFSKLHTDYVWKQLYHHSNQRKEAVEDKQFYVCHLKNSGPTKSFVLSFVNQRLNMIAPTLGQLDIIEGSGISSFRENAIWMKSALSQAEKGCEYH